MFLILFSLIIFIGYQWKIEYYIQILRFREIPDFTRWILTDKYIAKLYAPLLGFKVPQTYTLVKYIPQIKEYFEELETPLENYVIKPVDLCDSGGVYLVKNETNCRTNQPISVSQICHQLQSLRSKIGDEYYMHEKMFGGLIPYTGYLVEELLLDDEDLPPRDYKCYVFGGKLYYTAMTYNRRLVNGKQIFDSLWLDQHGKPLFLPMIKKGYRYQDIKLPPEYSKMKELVENAGKKLDRHCRIDVYLIRGEVYLGEFTFFCGAKLHTKLGNLRLGLKWLKHPDNYSKEDVRLRKLVPKFYNVH